MVKIYLLQKDTTIPQKRLYRIVLPGSKSSGHAGMTSCHEGSSIPINKMFLVKQATSAATWISLPLYVSRKNNIYPVSYLYQPISINMLRVNTIIWHNQSYRKVHPALVNYCIIINVNKSFSPVVPMWVYSRGSSSTTVFPWTFLIFLFSFSFWLIWFPVVAMTISSPSFHSTSTFNLISEAPAKAVSSRSVHVVSIGRPTRTVTHHSVVEIAENIIMNA